MQVSLSFLSLPLFLGFAVASLGPYSEIIVANKKISPDGFDRIATLAGETEDTLSFPGPVLKAHKHDHFSINVVNKLSDPSLSQATSIHWHGIFQHRTTYSDGAAYVSQCPLTPNSSFCYKFESREQAGTFWYHSHYRVQYCDGLRGALVLYDDEDPHKWLYDVDDESTIITLSDWYHQTYTGGLPPVPDSTLINGKGRYVNGPPVDLSVITVEWGKRYRFRVISTSCEPLFNFAIDNHTLIVIEADGQSTEPLLVDTFQIHAAQRYSVILEANQAIGNYWVRSNPDANGLPGFDNLRNLAILRYVGAPISDPDTDPTIPVNYLHPLSEVDLHPLENPSAPGPPQPGAADVSLNLVSTFDNSSGRFMMNGVSFQPPNVPVLLQILSGVQNAGDLLPNGSVYNLPPNKVIEITFPGTPGTPHPFHLHGHAFSVIRSAGSSVYNFENPVRRDTVSIGNTSDLTTIRFVTDNDGPWILHCHKEVHLELGLAVVLAEDIPGIGESINPPLNWYELCPVYSKNRDQAPK